MNINFTIENESFTIDSDSIYSDTPFTIKSFPNDYHVFMDDSAIEFDESDIILIDKNVKNLYGITSNRLIEIDAIEENKSMQTCLRVCDKLIEYGFSKKDTLTVIGGGIIQDIAAFSSKMFKRGINWQFYPTTLLSMCDSCIGGKTALNFNNHKNQLALFSSPTRVIINTNYLNTLHANDYISGYGEIIKLFSIAGDYFLNRFNQYSIKQLILYALSIKKSIIERDEFDTGVRKSLNYGHSFGHVIEPMSNYSISHGEAVLLGMDIVNKLFEPNDKIQNLIHKYTSLDKINKFNIDDIINNLKSDKKVMGDCIELISVTPGNTKFNSVKIDKELRNRLYEIFTH